MVEIVRMLQNILTLSDTSAIIKIILIILTVVFGVYMALYGRSLRRKNAREQEARDAIKNQANAVKQNTSDNQQVKSDSQRVDDFLKGEKDGKS